MANIKNLMDKEKANQEQEFDRILKERLDRRRRLKEKQHAKEIHLATEEAEKDLDGEYGDREKALREQSTESQKKLVE